MDNQLQRPIPQSRFDELCRKPKTDETLKDLACLFLDEMEYLTQKITVDVLLCAYPFSLVEYLDQDTDESVSHTDDDSEDRAQGAQAVSAKMIFHDFLKAQAMRFSKPTQIVRPGTYDERKRLKRKHPSGATRQTQDEATRAWNMYTALYYKAGGTPWRLVRDSSQLDTCYVGLSFYKTLDESKLLTSTAQASMSVGRVSFCEVVWHISQKTTDRFICHQMTPIIC